MEAANLLNFHPLGRSKSYHEGFIMKKLEKQRMNYISNFYIEFIRKLMAVKLGYFQN